MWVGKCGVYFGGVGILLLQLQVKTQLLIHKSLRAAHRQSISRHQYKHIRAYTMPGTTSFPTVGWNMLLFLNVIFSLFMQAESGWGKMNINRGTILSPWSCIEREREITKNLMERFMWVTKLLERSYSQGTRHYKWLLRGCMKNAGYSILFTLPWVPLW